MKLEQEQKEITGQFNQLRPRYMEAIIALRAGGGEPVYPDANGTLRVTFGNVAGYSPRDGILYTPVHHRRRSPGEGDRHRSVQVAAGAARGRSRESLSVVGSTPS